MCPTQVVEAEAMGFSMAPLLTAYVPLQELFNLFKSVPSTETWKGCLRQSFKFFTALGILWFVDK